METSTLNHLDTEHVINNNVATFIKYTTYQHPYKKKKCDKLKHWTMVFKDTISLFSEHIRR